MTLSLQDANDILRARLARMMALTAIVDAAITRANGIAIANIATIHHDALFYAQEEVNHAWQQWRKAGGQA
jgi:hypothetical protein